MKSQLDWAMLHNNTTGLLLRIVISNSWKNLKPRHPPPRNKGNLKATRNPQIARIQKIQIEATIVCWSWSREIDVMKT